MDNIIQQMKALGLTEYEAKAYLSLLKDYHVNGYALSKNSGIPRSRIYEVLDGLVKKQVVFEEDDGKASQYIPLEPSLLTEKLRLDFEKSIALVDSFANDLYKAEVGIDGTKQLRGHDAIIAMVKVLIKDANHRVALSIWDEELQMIGTELNDAISRGVLIRGMHFGSVNHFDTLVSHRRMDRYIAEYKERYFILIIDDRHIISGIMSRGNKAQVTWSTDPAVIKISDDYIAHDVMINTYNRMLEGAEKRQYEERLDDVRKNYYGFSDEEFSRFPTPE